ncbi:restriction endonuclease subunit S, partial [bacterium]
QKKIVARLDALSAKIQKLQEYQKSTQSDLVKLEQSVLHSAFQR